jgi:hypothetical protein
LFTPESHHALPSKVLDTFMVGIRSSRKCGLDPVVELDAIAQFTQRCHKPKQSDTATQRFERVHAKSFPYQIPLFDKTMPCPNIRLVLFQSDIVHLERANFCLPITNGWRRTDLLHGIPT